MTVGSSRFVVALDATSPSTPGSEAVGGKGAALYRLALLGQRTPLGIAVTTAAFELYLDDLGLSSVVAALQPGRDGRDLEQQALAELAEQVASGGVREELTIEVLACCDRWAAAGQAMDGFIVRSSATVEDSASHSYAGIFESLPVADRGGIVEAMRQVWASVFSPRAFAYYRLSKLGRVPTMALVIQPFIAAERSGVMFTEFQSPAGESQLLIEHVEGDCEKLVTGQANPDRLWLPRWPQVDDPALAGESTAPLAGCWAVELVEIARELEDKLGAAQDVEWCATESELYVVQARPITTFGAVSDAAAPITDREPLLAGVAASPGRASGTAHLVFNITDADALESGSVLVTAMTNPNMVTAMNAAAAVVTDVGGMICHAAIVSRELGVPCVVGTETATQVIGGGDLLTVDGSQGSVFEGLVESTGPEADAPALDWPALWNAWSHNAGHSWLPLLSTLDALRWCPPEPPAKVVVAPYLDLQLDTSVQASPLERLTSTVRQQRFERYVESLDQLRDAAGVESVYLSPLYLDSYTQALADAAASAPAIAVLELEHPSPQGVAAKGDGVSLRLLLDPSREAAQAVPEGTTTVVPLTLVELAAIGAADQGVPPAEDGGEGVFGRAPASRAGAMPAAARRQPYLDLIPALAAVHAEPGAAPESSFDWLDLRPEVPITPLLKSLVLAGIETIPRELGFDDLPPLHVTWKRCRFHFRADSFMALWARLQQASWDSGFMAGMLSRTRASYAVLEAAAGRLPAGEALRAAPAGQLRSAFVPWLHAFTEFFALSFFIQALGDDCQHPLLAETVEAGERRIAAAGLFAGYSCPGSAVLSTPTQPVRTAEYLADLSTLRAALLAAGATELQQALAAIDPETGVAAAGEAYARVRERWQWMRERDLYYEPYDTPEIIVGKALGIGEARLPDYQANAEAAKLALSVHFDLAHLGLGHGGGEPQRFAHAVGFGHWLAIEREDHHIVWLESSYPVRKLCLEWQRRLAESADLRAGDIFFLEAPEILSAVGDLPTGLPADLLARLRNRRRGYEREMALKAGTEASDQIAGEEDYY